MQPILLAIFYVLISVSIYAADKTDKPVSHSAEKAEVVNDANLLRLKISTDGGFQEHYIDPTDYEMFSAEPLEDTFKENAGYGVPTFLGTTTSLDDKDKPYTNYYELNSLLTWFNTNGTDPLLRTKTVVNISAFVVRPLPNTTPQQYKASFLTNGQHMPQLVDPLLRRAALFANNPRAKTNPEMAKAEFYSSVAKASIEGELQKNKESQKIALKMIKIAREQLNPNNIGTSPYLASCLATAGDIYLAQDNVTFAIESYSEARDLTGHMRSFHALNNLYIKLGNDFNRCRIKLLKKQVHIEPALWFQLGLLQNASGKKEQSRESFSKYNALVNSFPSRGPSILKRSHAPTHENNESAAAKRAKPSSSSSNE